MKTFQLFLLLYTLTTTGIYSRTSDSTKVLRKNIVFDNTITVYAGEKLFIETGLNNNNEIFFTPVSEISDSSKTMVIDFRDKSFGGQTSFILDISNPFDKSLVYQAFIQINEGEYFKETNVVPVYPHIRSMEMWPYKIYCIKLSQFRLEDSEADE
jgi:hypothetical protein